MGEQGERLNPSPATLREWRREFARRLREQGIEANATERRPWRKQEPKKDRITAPCAEAHPCTCTSVQALL